MPLCETYMDMSPYERSIYTGSLIHAVMNDEALLKMGQDLIDLGKLKGIFDKVTLNPEASNQNHLPDQTTLQ